MIIERFDCILLIDKDNIIIDLLDYIVYILENGKKELENKIEYKIEKNRLDLELKNRLEKLEYRVNNDRHFFYLFIIFFLFFLIFFIFSLYIIYLFTIRIKYIEFY